MHLEPRGTTTTTTMGTTMSATPLCTTTASWVRKARMVHPARSASEVRPDKRESLATPWLVHAVPQARWAYAVSKAPMGRPVHPVPWCAGPSVCEALRVKQASQATKGKKDHDKRIG
jgi:hypothetical protein